jgi:hypothetical protein
VNPDFTKEAPAAAPDGPAIGAEMSFTVLAPSPGTVF